MDRKKITIQSSEDRALSALANDEDGADYGVLVTLVDLILSGRDIEPDFQKVANAIVAQSILVDRLPPKKKGRPKDSNGVHGWSIAYQYFQLVDGGMRYADAVAQVAATFHKDERHIMRLVKANKRSIGETPNERERTREWWRLCAEMEAKVIASGGQSGRSRWANALEALLAKERERDPIAELGEMIGEVVARRILPDVK